MHPYISNTILKAMLEKKICAVIFLKNDQEKKQEKKEENIVFAT